MTNSNILATASKSMPSPSINNSKSKAELINDSTNCAYADVVEIWGKNYQAKFAEYKQQIRLIVAKSQLKSAPEYIDETIFNELPSPSIFVENSNSNGGK